MEETAISVLEMSIVDVNSEYVGVDRLLLMENAGRSLADLSWSIYKEKKCQGNIVIFCGRGGNGGDGMVAARHLTRYVSVDVYLIGVPERISSTITYKNWENLTKIKMGLSIKTIQSIHDVEKIEIKPSTLVIDAILGTGIHGNMREPLKTLINKVNDAKKDGIIIISADTPTGVNPDTGETTNVFIKADYTCVFHKRKQGLNNKNAGKIKVAPIGIHPWAEKIVGPGHLLAIKRKSAWSHKGDAGRILIIGGSHEYSGAPALSGLAALRAGADLVTIFTSNIVANVIRGFSPELIVREYNYPAFNVNCITPGPLDRYDTLLIGPGLGLGNETKEAVLKIIDMAVEQNLKIIIDADALKIVDIRHISENTVVTPHAGEFSIMTNKTLPSSQRDFNKRIEIVKSITSRSKGVWVVKGHWDIISSSKKLQINTSGTPLMTKGGTGDVLAGLISAFSAVTDDVFLAACIGCFINGKAGEMAADNFCLESLLANIPLAINASLDFIKKVSRKN